MSIVAENQFVTTSAQEFDESAAHAFLEDGFSRVDDGIDQEELSRLREIYDWCFSNDADDKVKRKALGGKDQQGRQALPQVLRPSNAVPELCEMEYFKRVKGIAQAVFGQEVQLRGEHMILKPAGYGVATPWHQDQAYHDPAYRYRNINFWLPLDGAAIEGGCMQFVAGSHHGPILPHTYLDPSDSQTAMVAQDQKYWSLNGTAVPCPVGSCSLHHSYMLHYAGPNLTDQPRRAYIVVFGCQPVKARRPWYLPWRDSQTSSNK